MYWDIKKPLSYNALFNFIVGARGVGKTFGTLSYCIENYNKNKRKFIYLRRYQNELDETFPTIHRPLTEKFIEYDLGTKGKDFKINDETAGYGCALSTSLKLKSQSFPDVTDIIFDEFIIDTGKVSYLKNEVQMFLEFYETIARTRDVRVWFISNALTITNPYFIYFNIQLPYQKEISCKNDILIQICKNKEYADFKKQTRFGKIVEGTQYAKYAFDNEFLKDNYDFIEKKSANSKFEFIIIFKSVWYGVWIDYEKGIMYISNDYNENTYFKYTLLADDMSPNLMLIKGKPPQYISLFLEMFKFGLIRFENINIKNLCMELIKYAL